MEAKVKTGSQLSYIVLNPIAGHSSAEAIRERLDELLAPSGWQVEVYETTGEEDVAELTRQACRRGAGLVVAAGGDGTVTAVINGIVGTEIPLGILPVGTGNGLARGLQIPIDVDKAIDLIAGEHDIRSIDTMRVKDQHYVLNVSAGISAGAMRNTPPEVKRRFGVAAYLWTIIKELIGIQPRRFRLKIDDRLVMVRATEVLVSNGSILKERLTLLGPPEDFTDRRLDVQIVTADSLFDHLKMVWGLVLRHTREPRLTQIQVKKKIYIETRGRPVTVQADGELIGSTPIEVSMVPASVRIIVPKQVNSEEG